MTSAIIRSAGLPRAYIQLLSANLSTNAVRFKDVKASSKRHEAPLISKEVALMNSEQLEQLRQHDEYITIQEPSQIIHISGVPEEHIKSRRVRIFMPPKNAMQSGTDNIGHWEIEFETRERWENPLMGWSSTGDPLSNMTVKFTEKVSAIEFCEKNGWRWFVQEDANQKEMKPKSYANNFLWDKRTRVSTK